jgi:hypothetical protein
MGCGLLEDDILVCRRSVMETVNRLKEYTEYREKKRGCNDRSPHLPQLDEQEQESDGLDVTQSNFISIQLLLNVVHLNTPNQLPRGKFVTWWNTQRGCVRPAKPVLPWISAYS